VIFLLIWCLLLLLLLLCVPQVVDADILAVINKLAKQRKDSIEQYTAGVWTVASKQ
jgi:hypothetical protein